MQHRSPRRRGPILAALVALATIAAACGGDDASGGDSTPASEAPSSEAPSSEAPSSEAPATDAPAADPLGEPNPASGDPVKIGLVTESGSDSLSGVSAGVESGAGIGVEYANEYLGGIGGRPIELVICGNKATPAGATDCANQMIEEGVVAVVWPFSGQSETLVNVLAPAGIPGIVGSGSTQAELTTPGVFATSGGFAGTLAAFAVSAKENGVKKFTMLVIDVPAATGGANALGGIAFGTMGVPFEVIPVPVGTADMTPQLQAAASGGADAIGVVGDESFCTTFLQGFETLALDATKYVITTCITDNVVEAVPTGLEGAVSVSVAADGSDSDLYQAIIAKYAADDDVNPEFRLSPNEAGGMGSVLNVVRAMAGLSGDVTAESVMAQIKAAKNVELWLGGGITFTCDGKAVPILPNICSSSFQIGSLNADGTFKELSLIEAAQAFAA